MTTPDTLVERVARALVPALCGSIEDACGRDLPDMQFDDLPADWQERHLEYARIAINASGLATRITELEDDLRIWKSEAADRSQGMIDLNLDRASMGVENQKLREQLTEAHAHADQLAEACEPFVEAMRHLHPAHPDDGETLDGFKVGDFRKLSTALANFNAWRVG